MTMHVYNTMHAAKIKTVTTFTHILADYSYMASEHYSSLYFEELLWINFNYLCKLNYNISL